jgi:hypothetical protein
MRIKAVLRDADILEMQVGSKERVLATVRKNLDRVVNTGSLLKVMGLPTEGRIQLLEILDGTSFHVWLMKDNEQHLILISETENQELDGYQWR